MTANPYSPPRTDSEEPVPQSADGERLELMAKGQKMIIWAIALYFPIVGSSSAMPRGAPASLAVLFLAAFVGIIVLSLVGVLRLSRGLGIPLALRILFGVMIFVPLLNILILALLSSQATKSLRKAGYRVGFFGASKPA